MLESLRGRTLADVEATLATPVATHVARQFGIVTSVSGGVVRIDGLPGLMAEECVEFDGGAAGMAIDLAADSAGIVLLGGAAPVAGARAHATGRLVGVPVGEALLGRVIDPAGRPLDELGPLPAGLSQRPVEAPAPAIINRAPVTVPLRTGVKSIDTLVPIGLGQRELIVGDRQTGKTTLALDAMLNQRDTGIVSIYCAIGQRGTAVARVIDALRAADAMSNSVVVVAAGEDPPGLQTVAPFAAMTIAEWFLERGRHALVVFDDLTRHARAYREMSLLLRRPPGREAYPGDIFYLHARLLERATQLRASHGGGSLTALPIVETQAQDIAAYIPTNLISITDGQIALSPELFHRGILPAIDIGRSVSRVGAHTQLPAHRRVSARLRLAYAQFEELETFARFAGRLDELTRRTIERGRRVREVLKQEEHAPLTASGQIAVLHAAAEGLFDVLALDQVAWGSQVVIEATDRFCRDEVRRIETGEALRDVDWQRLRDVAADALRQDRPELKLE